MAGKKHDLLGVMGANKLSNNIMRNLLRQILAWRTSSQCYASGKGSRVYKSGSDVVYGHVCLDLPSCLELPSAV